MPPNAQTKKSPITTTGRNHAVTQVPTATPDSLLNAMLSGLIFFDSEGIIFRTNTTACKDLHLADSVAGCKLGDVCSIDFRGSNILADLLSRFQDPAVTQVPLTQDALLCTKRRQSILFCRRPNIPSGTGAFRVRVPQYRRRDDQRIHDQYSPERIQNIPLVL